MRLSVAVVMSAMRYGLCKSKPEEGSRAVEGTRPVRARRCGGCAQAAQGAESWVGLEQKAGWD